MAEPRFLSLQGSLVKGTGMKSNQRYFTLQMRSLAWYKSKAECDEMGKIIGKIDLSDPMTEIVVPTQKKIKKDVFQFNIITPGKSGKTYELFAENAESWAEWIRCTAHNIINSQKQTAGSPQRRSLLQMAALGQCELKTHVGWLYRKSKRKFVRIEGMTMSYFTDKPPKGKIEGNYSLFAVTIERLEGPSFRIVMPESTVGPKVFDWDADSVQAREEWISIIEGNQGTLEKTFAAKSQLGAGAGGDGGGGGVGGGSGKTGFYMSLPDILKPFEAEMGEGVIPEGFKEEVTRLSKEVLAEAKKNTTILKATLESPVLESVVQQDTGSLSQTRKDGSTTLEKQDKSITIRTKEGIIVKRNKQGAVLRKAPNGDIFQSTANGDAIHKKSGGHQTQVTENGTLLFLVDPDETSIQIDLQDFSVIIVNDEENYQIEVDMEEGFTLEIRGETKTKQFKDGCKVVVEEDGKKTQYNTDGSKIEFFPDGTRVDTSVDGRVVRKVDAAATKVENQIKVIPFKDPADDGPYGLVLRRGMWDNKNRMICSGIVADSQADLCSALAVGDVLSKIGETEITDATTVEEAMQILTAAPKPVDVTFVSYADEEDTDLALESIYPCPTHFREVFDHDEIIRLRRNFVEFVQDGGVPIDDLPDLDIEEEVVDDLLTKHRNNAQALINFGAFLAAKLESDKYAAIRLQNEREAGAKQTEAELRAELKRVKQRAEQLESGGAARSGTRGPRKAKSKASFDQSGPGGSAAPQISEEEQRQLEENLKAMGLAAPEDEESDEEMPPPPPPE